jgi:hypothetical protein
VHQRLGVVLEVTASVGALLGALIADEVPETVLAVALALVAIAAGLANLRSRGLRNLPHESFVAEEPGEWQCLEPEEMAILPGTGRQHAANQVLVRDLLAAAEEDRAPQASGHDARAALEMILAAYESHLRGGRVALPMARRTHPLSTQA